MAGTSPIVQTLNAELAKYPRLDPNAVRAIAAHEGLSGGVGDNGTSFGDFQLHAGGALPQAVWAHGAQYADQWAKSPAGIDYALNAINKVAGGLKGLPAIQAISTRFERPANPQAEIADAAHHYGLPYTGGTSAAPPAADTPGPFGHGPSPVIAALKMLGFNAPPRAFKPPAAPTLSTLTPAATPTAFQAGPGPLRLSDIAGIPVDQKIAPQVGNVIKQFGVTPTSGYRAPGHNAAVGGAENSDHLRGDAVDFSGSPQALQTLYRWALRQNFPYVEPMAQAKDHVHISFAR